MLIKKEMLMKKEIERERLKAWTRVSVTRQRI